MVAHKSVHASIEGSDVSEKAYTTAAPRCIEYTANLVTTDFVLLCEVSETRYIIERCLSYFEVSQRWPRRSIDRDRVVRRSAASAVGF